MTRFVDFDESDVGSPGRQVMPDERRLLEQVRDRQRDQPDGCAIQLVDLAEQVGIHPQRAREIARTWANEGRYSFGCRVAIGRLTAKGLTKPLP